MAKSLRELILDYFMAHPNEPLAHDDWVDEILSQYRALHGRTHRDPHRSARKLHENGYLVKVKKGVYMYDPDYVHEPELEDFTPEQRAIILERDGYRCVICGLGEADGVELQVDHIRPKDKGGKATIANGQTLCAPHNFRKKNYNQTETSKLMFIRLYDSAKEAGDTKLLAFIRDILAVYETHNINGHIEWNIPED